MKVIRINAPKNHLLHIETELGVINIRQSIQDSKGRRVVSCEVIPTNAAGQRKVIRSGYGNTRLIELKRRS